MDTWKAIFRNGIAPQLTLAALESLRDALESDDQRLLQTATTSPPPLRCVADWPCEGADAVAWTGWQGGKNPACTLIRDVEEHFARVCMDCDFRMGEAGAVRHFLNWYDDTPRDEMRRELLAEVERAIEEREPAAPPPVVQVDLVAMPF